MESESCLTGFITPLVPFAERRIIEMKNRIIFSFAGSIIVLVISIAILCPSCSRKQYEPDGEAIFSLTTNDIVAQNNCDISPDGKISVIGGDPYIVFDIPQISARCVAVSFMEKAGESFVAQLYFAEDGNFCEQNSCKSGLFYGDTEVVFSLPELNYNTIRVDIDCNYALKSIDFFEDAPIVRFSSIKVPVSRYFIAGIIALLSGVVLFVIDRYTNVFSRFLLFLKMHYKKLFLFLFGIVCVCLLGAGIEFLISHCIMGMNSVGQYFTISRYAFITAIIAIMYCFFFWRKNFEQKPERIFLCLTLIMGTLMIVASPFGHKSWDLDSHFSWAVNASYFKDSYVSAADAKIYYVDAESMVKSSLSESKSAITLFNDYDQEVIAVQNNKTTIAHRLSGIFIAVSRMFGASFYQQFLLGEFANLLIYAVVCFQAIKKLNSGKMILTVIALFPTNLFLATSYSYDYWVTCFSFLGMAYFISEMQEQDKPITRKNTIIMCGSFFIACLPKLLYAPALLIPFFMHKTSFSKKEHRKYLGFCTAALVLLLGMLLLKSLTTISNGGDMRGGAEISSYGQIQYIFAAPFTYMKTLFKFLMQYLSFGNMGAYIVNFAYLGTGVCSGAFIFLMLFTAITDKKRYDKYRGNLVLKIASILFYVGMAALIATALYIDFTPVGSEQILGCQARYLIPLLFPLMSLIGNPGVCTINNRAKYNFAVMFTLAVAVLYNIYHVMLLKAI